MHDYVSKPVSSSRAFWPKCMHLSFPGTTPSPGPSHNSSINHLNNIMWRAQIMKIPIVQLSLSSCYCLSLKSTYSREHWFYLTLKKCTRGICDGCLLKCTARREAKAGTLETVSYCLSVKCRVLVCVSLRTIEALRRRASVQKMHKNNSHWQMWLDLVLSLAWAT